MFDYFVGFLVVLLFISFYYLLGSAVLKNQDSFSKSIIFGYIVFSFFTAIFLIPIQLLHLSWNLANIIVISLCLLSVAFIVFRIKNKQISFSLVFFKQLIKNNYFLFIISILLIGIYLLQFDLIWINNHLDDGYYLVKIATLPYLEEPFSTSYSSGIVTHSVQFDSYLLSSYELEQSIYVSWFHIDPVIYCRIFLNYFNYFLVANTVCLFAQTILGGMRSLKKQHFQYFSIILIFFSFEYLVLQRTGLFVVQDSWQFSSAMWYGSSIGRMMGLMWILILFANISKITIKEIILAFAVSIVLISKSAVSLSVIFVGGLSFLLVFFLTGNKMNRFIGIILFLLIVILGWILPDSEVRNSLIINNFLKNKYSIVLIGSIVFSAWALFKFKKEKTLVRSILVLLISTLIILVPEINDSFEFISQYDFVACRFQATLFYTIVISGFILFLIFIKIYLPKLYNLMVPVSLGLALIGSVLTTVPIYGNPVNTIKIMLDNPNIMPQSTVQLSKELNKLPGEVNVLCPDWINVDNHRHSLAVMLRTYAPNVKVISALPRFSVPEGNRYANFKQDQQNVYTHFVSNPNYLNFEMLQTIIKDYKINCLVFPTDCFESYSLNSGFKFYMKSGPYYLYLKV